MATAAASVSIITPEALLQRARDLIPALKARSEAATDARQLPAETISYMQEAGFFRVLQPKRHGGYEMDPQVFYDIQMTLAEGCMSTAWVYGVIGVAAVYTPKDFELARLMNDIADLTVAHRTAADPGRSIRR